MKASKALYSKCFDEYKLDEKTLKDLQECLLGIFLDIKKVCDEHNIKYILSGGTCLGAIRHKGFIPWDDDIDIMMIRPEYEKFAEVFKKESSDKYILAEPLVQEKYFCKMPKVYKKGTTYIEIPNAGVHGLDMVFVDIFIIENVPKSKFKRSIIGKMYDFCFKGSSTCIDYLYPSFVIEEKAKENKELDKYYKFRRRLGFFFSHIGGMKFWLRKCDKLAQKYKNKNTKTLSIPSGLGYTREVFDENIFTELDTAEFCGYEVNVPKNYDTYLKNIYGDYMKIPPKDKRESHVAYKINF